MDTAAADSQQTRLISGWMKKKGDKGLVKGWKNRWFQEKDDKKIYYYESRGDAEALGCIEIEKITALAAGSEGAFGFAISVPGRVYYLQAFTEHDRQDWLQLLRQKTNLPLTQLLRPSVALPATRSVPNLHGPVILRRPKSKKTDEELRVELDTIRREMGLASLEGFYTVSWKQTKLPAKALGGLSLYDALTQAYPDHTWLPWLFKKAPFHWYSTREQQRRYFDWLLEKKGFQADLTGFYSIGLQDYIDSGGLLLLRKQYDYSISKALQVLYPEHHWELWRFPKAPDGYLSSMQQQRALMDSIAAKLLITDKSQWYNITKKQIIKAGGAHLLKQYHDSPSTLLKAVYSEHAWLPWLFKKASTSFWTSLSNQRDFFDWCFKQLQLQSMNDWYRVRASSIHKLGGSGLMTHQYNDNIYDAMTAVYPDYNWIPWKFNRVPRSFWDAFDNRKAYFDWLSAEIGIKKPDDWYKVTGDKIHDNSGGSLLLKYYGNSLYSAMSDVYPDHPWDESQFLKTNWLRAKSSTGS